MKKNKNTWSKITLDSFAWLTDHNKLNIEAFIHRKNKLLAVKYLYDLMTIEINNGTFKAPIESKLKLSKDYVDNFAKKLSAKK